MDHHSKRYYFYFVFQHWDIGFVKAKLIFTLEHNQEINYFNFQCYRSLYGNFSIFSQPPIQNYGEIFSIFG